MEEAKYEDFNYLNTSEHPSGRRLRFGKTVADRLPFILTVAPSYVARKTQQRTIPIVELRNYCKDHVEELRKIAFSAKQSGRSTLVLE
jgi:hypothetical protein